MVAIKVEDRLGGNSGGFTAIMSHPFMAKYKDTSINEMETGSVKAPWTPIEPSPKYAYAEIDQSDLNANFGMAETKAKVPPEAQQKLFDGYELNAHGAVYDPRRRSYRKSVHVRL